MDHLDFASFLFIARAFYSDYLLRDSCQRLLSSPKLARRKTSRFDWRLKGPQSVEQFRREDGVSECPLPVRRHRRAFCCGSRCSNFQISIIFSFDLFRKDRTYESKKPPRDESLFFNALRIARPSIICTLEPNKTTLNPLSRADEKSHDTRNAINNRANDNVLLAKKDEKVGDKKIAKNHDDECVATFPYQS